MIQLFEDKMEQVLKRYVCTQGVTDTTDVYNHTQKEWKRLVTYEL